MLVEANAFYDKIKRRHTVRDYTDRPVCQSALNFDPLSASNIDPQYLCDG
jgi:hypothetical protein